MSAKIEKVRVIIVDDHPMVREGLRSMLNTPEITVVGEVSSGEEALRMIADRTPDVALVDIRMPDMDGLELIEAIQKTELPIKTIMVTTYKKISYLLRALAAGASGFVLKDISREELLETIHAVATGTSYIDHGFLQDVIRDLDETRPDVEKVVLDLVEPLTPREMDVLRLLVEGLSNRAIAHALGISPGTVKGYVQTIFEKLVVSDRTQAAVKAIRSGLVH
ncbi:MAG TPA: response regulator transcription factor [Anaerolineae bacterium]|nr:response regulator transcription factor [Anaerolineae bacterium]